MRAKPTLQHPGTQPPTALPSPSRAPTTAPRSRAMLAIASSPCPSLQPRLGAAEHPWSHRAGHCHRDAATPAARPLTLEVGQRHHLAGSGAGRGRPPFPLPPPQ